MAAKAPYLEDNLDSLEPLLLKLRSLFTLMRNLDNFGQEEMKTIDRLTDNFVQNICDFDTDERTERVKHIQTLYKKAQAHADDKIQLTMQTYHMVNMHIKRLDADLARFESDLKKKGFNPHSSDSDINTKKKGRKVIEKVEKKKGRQSISSVESTPKPGRKKKQTVQPEITTLSTLTLTRLMSEPVDVRGMSVDPNEPKYCFCHQVSYDEMIACDNPDECEADTETLSEGKVSY